MVSPKSHRSHANDHIEESNTTASWFLGGVRRNWMGPQANTESSGTPNLSRVLPGHPDSFPRESLMSPVTPGETLPSSRAVHLAKNPDIPRATALPSPVLSTTSHPSPVSANVIVSNPPTLPVANQFSVPRREDERMAVQRLPSGPVEQRATQSPLVRTSWPQTHLPLDTGSQERRLSGQPEPQVQNEDALTVISEQRWKEWSIQLDSLTANLRAKGALPPADSREPSIARPRIDLLHQAINRRDSFYLVMHQLYCRLSIDPNTLGQIRAPEAGMKLLVPLLEDNGKMHKAATVAFAQFPAPSHHLMQSKWYLQVLTTVPEFLSRLASEWQGIWLQAPHPPLVANLWAKLALPSPILMSVMFMCVARRLHHETYIKPLLELFWQDVESFKRCKDAGIPDTTQQALNWNFIQEYLKFPRLSGSSSQTLSSPHPAHPRQSESMPQSTLATSSPNPRPSIAGNQPINVPPTPAASYRNYMPNAPQGQVAGPVAVAYQDSVPAPQLQNPSQYRQYNPILHGHGQDHGQDQGQWHQIHPQMQQMQQIHPMQPMRGQLALGQVHPSRIHHIPQFPQEQRMQRQPVMPTLSTPHNPPLQSIAVNSAQSAQSIHGSSPMSTSVVTTPLSAAPISNHMVQHLIPQRSSNSLNRQHSLASQPSAFPVVHAPPQIPNFQNLPHSPLLPAPGWRAPITVNPVPMRLGLHLADLRDPMKKLVKHDSDGKEMSTELFSYLDSFIVQPTIIKPDQPIYTWAFPLTSDECEKFPSIVQGKEGRCSVWTFKPGCRTYRLRCIRVPGTPATVNDRTWSVMATFWPSVFYVTVNDKELYVRRKVHNGKDLPLDITEYLRSGENNVRVDFILGQDECKSLKYVFAVEAMEVAEFDQVLSLVQSIPAAKSRADIQKRLSPVTNDDELAVVTDNLTIGLVDPFMARIFDIPVRSRNCGHPECFDRDTYIRTRQSESGPTPMIDNWRCPICKTDARPQSLVVDQFLAEVHAELARTNRLDMAKAIQIKADGTWTLKVDSDETSPGADKHLASGSTAVKRKAGSLSSSPYHSGPRSKTETSSARPSPTIRTQEPTVIELD
ncbi:Zinc finger MIZ-type [Penicillium paradoxum]|uniref:Zinc finger MIZ-type n=1 Tax=Penicillium paradoxum TaxID=176176 RepID=UPI002548AC04|nr:Zinc finger MIZ-type [Penicillium paradoxum]KAJ5774316.1 Zinc finger MIZ-type [Penicillium paradoxum]